MFLNDPFLVLLGFQYGPSTSGHSNHDILYHMYADNTQLYFPFILKFQQFISVIAQEEKCWITYDPIGVLKSLPAY